MHSPPRVLCIPSYAQCIGMGQGWWRAFVGICRIPGTRGTRSIKDISVSGHENISRVLWMQ